MSSNTLFEIRISEKYRMEFTLFVMITFCILRQKNIKKTIDNIRDKRFKCQYYLHFGRQELILFPRINN
jgi:hypothetical protein